MPLFIKNKLLFIHIPRTGGTSIEKFIESKIKNCDFSKYEDDFVIELGESDAEVSIDDSNVKISLNMDVEITKEEDVGKVKKHSVKISSDLGKLYDSAKEVYDYEQDELFLEEYTLDILNLYAPVEGVEITCSPQVWSVYDIFEDVQKAVEENLAVIKTEGDSEDYFVLEYLSGKIPDDVYVDFFNSANWPVTFEVEPSEGILLVADPVGDELGLGSLGFCYVSYHFVYDFKYPVMVQLRSEDTGEIFQFPLAVIIEGTNPRESLIGESSISEEPEICENANTEFKIQTLNSDSEKVESTISFECFSQTCSIGTTDNGVLTELFPQCVNGYVVATADGYKDAEVEVSTVNSGSLTIFMDKLYDMDLSLTLDGSNYKGEAIITFENSNGESDSILYPTQTSVSLSQGTYNISVSVYTNVSLELGSSTQEYCVEVPRTIIGVLGFTKTECYEVEVPEQLISNALSGGGTSSYTFTESILMNNDEIIIDAPEFPEPDSLLQIQENYVLFENKKLGVSLK